MFTPRNIFIKIHALFINLTTYTYSRHIKEENVFACPPEVNFILFYYFKDYKMKMSDNICSSSILEIVQPETEEEIKTRSS